MKAKQNRIISGKEEIKDEEESNMQWREKKTRRQKAIRSIRMKYYTKSEENTEGKTWKEGNQDRKKIRKRRKLKKCRMYKVKILRKMNKAKSKDKRKLKFMDMKEKSEE